MKKALDKFFADKAKRVFMVYGDWGIGKTHVWRQYTTKLKDKDIYISLFGISRFEELQKLICSKANIFRNKNWLTRIMYFVGLGRKFNIVMDAIDEFSIRDLVICFDDFERKGSTLSLLDIFGHISLLAEENNCKVVIIMNRDRLEGGDKEELDTYREKIIDGEFFYDPPVREMVKLIFNRLSGDDKNILISVYERLQIKNLRIMQRVRWFLEDYSYYFADDRTVRSDFITHVSILLSMYYNKEIKDFNEDFASNKYLEKNEMEERMASVGYNHDVYKNLVSDWIAGYLTSAETIHDMISFIKNDLKQRELSDKIGRLQDKFNDFSIDEEEYCRLWNDFLKENESQLSIFTLHGIKIHSNHLGLKCKFDIDIDELIGSKIESHTDDELRRLRKYSSGDIKALIQSALDSRWSKFSLGDIFDVLSDPQNENIEIALNIYKYGDDELYDYLLNRGGNTVAVVEEFVQFPVSGKRYEDSKDKLLKILKRIAETSDLNKRRVEKVLSKEG